MLQGVSLTLGIARILGVALAAGIAFVAFEDTVHSVHHLGERGEATACAIAFVTDNLAGTAVEPVGFHLAFSITRDMVLGPASSGPAIEHESPDQGRAPPAAA